MFSRKSSKKVKVKSKMLANCLNVNSVQRWTRLLECLCQNYGNVFETVDS